LHPVPLAPLLAKIDQKRLRALQAEYGSLPSSAPPLWRHYAKYLDVEKRLRLNVRRAQDLDLQRLPPREILDIGCGGGFFLFVAQSLGHRALGLDVSGIPVFDRLIELFRVERLVHRIAAFENLPDLGRKFDLISAFATAFHGGRGDDWRWQEEEWDFFLTDLKRHLKPGGQIFLDLNAAYQGRYYTPGILEVLQRHGGQIERGHVLIG
jgi:SAM-dependent methyltransferase